MQNFIEGIIFIIIIIPFLEGIMSIINQYAEYICTRIAVCTVHLKQTITEEVTEETPVIGFHIDTDDIDNDQEEEP